MHWFTALDKTNVVWKSLSGEDSGWHEKVLKISPALSYMLVYKLCQRFRIWFGAVQKLISSNPRQKVVLTLLTIFPIVVTYLDIFERISEVGWICMLAMFCHFSMGFFIYFTLSLFNVFLEFYPNTSSLTKVYQLKIYFAGSIKISYCLYDFGGL